MWKRLNSIWKDQSSDGVAAEPSEVRFRKVVLTLAALIGPPLVFFIYFKMMFPGLINPDALDFAQIGRNLSSGHGFVTYILRPLALQGDNPLRQPDVTHGPLFPFVLALAYGALGAKDWVSAVVSGIFFILTIPVVYTLGTRCFNRTIGLAAALIVMFNALLLQYAASGLHITLYIFLTTCTLLAVHSLSGKAAGSLPKGLLAVTGALAALLYLTEPIFFWVLPVLLVTIILLHPKQRVQSALWFALPLCVLTFPWMARNAMLTGNPVFGLRGMEVWMHTSTYEGLSAYRLTAEEMSPGGNLLKDVVKKLLLGTGSVIQAFPQVTASWVLAFFLPSLLFRFSDPSAHTVRRVTMYCFFGILIGTLLFGLQMPLFVSLIPTMLIFAVAFLLHLAQQAQLQRGSTALVAILVTVGVIYPLASDMTLGQKTEALPEAAGARVMGQVTRKGDVILSDQPWVVAWYAERPSLWIPVNDKKVSELRGRFTDARWLFLTPHAMGLSRQWQTVYQQFGNWKLVAYQARSARQQTPPNVRISASKESELSQGLDGFVAVDLPGSAMSTVTATVPTSSPKSANSGLQPESGVPTP